MKYVCIICRIDYDDGRPDPPQPPWMRRYTDLAAGLAEMKSHGICPACLPGYTAKMEADLKKLENGLTSRSEGNAKDAGDGNENENENKKEGK